MKIITKLHKFLDIIDPLMADEAEHFSIYPCSPSGIFWFARANELVEYCKKHPEFHIASKVATGVIVNYFNPLAVYYYLGMENPDPDIILINVSALALDWDPDVLELRKDEIPAVADYLDRIKKRDARKRCAHS